MSDSESESELIGRKHQELQALSYFMKKKLVFEYDSCDIPEFEGSIRSRPDFLFRGEVNVIVEIDENAHVGYPPDDEISRMREIWKAFDKNVLFIRVAIDRDKELSGVLLKQVYKMILDYQSDADIGSRMLVHYVNYPDKQVEKYRRFNGAINIINFEDVESLSEEDDVENLSEEEDITSTTTVTTVTATITTTKNTSHKKDFICDRCGYEAAQKCNLKTHLNRKKICTPKDSSSDVDIKLLLDKISTITPPKSHECTYCHKKYTTKSILNQHIKKCSTANTPILITKKDLNELKALLLGSN